MVRRQNGKCDTVDDDDDEICWALNPSDTTRFLITLEGCRIFLVLRLELTKAGEVHGTVPGTSKDVKSVKSVQKGQIGPLGDVPRWHQEKGRVLLIGGGWREQWLGPLQEETSGSSVCFACFCLYPSRIPPTGLDSLEPAELKGPLCSCECALQSQTGSV